jgi:hypothetical protein
MILPAAFFDSRDFALVGQFPKTYSTKAEASHISPSSSAFKTAPYGS